MKVHVLKHAPFEGLGNISEWLIERKAEITFTNFYENTLLPELTGIDLIIALGGPLSVNDEEMNPWLKTEKLFLKNAIKEGISVLGVCLGSQLIANALGEKVYKNSEKEIGWFQIESTGFAVSALQFPKNIKVFQWHGETFNLPEGSVHLAKSEVCVNQAFMFGKNVIALQFHLETTEESVQAMIENCSDELVFAKFVQSKQQLLAVGDNDYDAIKKIMHRLLSFITNQ